MSKKSSFLFIWRGFNLFVLLTVFMLPWYTLAADLQLIGVDFLQGV